MTIDAVCGINEETQEPRHMLHRKTTMCCDSRDCPYKFAIKDKKYQGLCLYDCYVRVEADK